MLSTAGAHRLLAFGFVRLAFHSVCFAESDRNFPSNYDSEENRPPGRYGRRQTSLVRQFLQGLFEEKYLSTVGVKVDKKQVAVGQQDVMLMVWDVADAEEHFGVPSSYIRGASGYLLVVDGTPPETLDRALDIVDVENNHPAGSNARRSRCF